MPFDITISSDECPDLVDDYVENETRYFNFTYCKKTGKNCTPENCPRRKGE